MCESAVSERYKKLSEIVLTHTIKHFAVIGGDILFRDRCMQANKEKYSQAPKSFAPRKVTIWGH